MFASIHYNCTNSRHSNMWYDNRAPASILTLESADRSGKLSNKVSTEVTGSKFKISVFVYHNELLISFFHFFYKLKFLKLKCRVFEIFVAICKFYKLRCIPKYARSGRFGSLKSVHLPHLLGPSLHLKTH